MPVVVPIVKFSPFFVVQNLVLHVGGRHQTTVKLQSLIFRLAVHAFVAIDAMATQGTQMNCATLLFC